MSGSDKATMLPLSWAIMHQDLEEEIEPETGFVALTRPRITWVLLKD